jgi:hypothetical protein
MRPLGSYMQPFSILIKGCEFTLHKANSQSLVSYFDAFKILTSAKYPIIGYRKARKATPQPTSR